MALLGKAPAEIYIRIVSGVVMETGKADLTLTVSSGLFTSIRGFGATGPGADIRSSQ